MHTHTQRRARIHKHTNTSAYRTLHSIEKHTERCEVHNAKGNANRYKEREREWIKLREYMNDLVNNTTHIECL